ncbi:MAG: hypothetical protein KAF27_05575, partial [Porphyrobacter sp.]|nr:hypothetical protein [Porphyrobacter sp.]
DKRFEPAPEELTKGISERYYLVGMADRKRYLSYPMLQRVFDDILAPPAHARRWVTEKRPYELWFSFLAVSPSYALAERFRSGTITEKEKAQIPEDFDIVLSVFEDLGPVRGMAFSDWWLRRGSEHMGFRGKEPHVELIARLESDEHRKDPRQVFASLNSFLWGNWSAAGEQDCILLALPTGMNKSDVIQQVSYYFDLGRHVSKPLVFEPPKYTLCRSRQDNESLSRYLKLLWTRCLIKKPLWSVGYLAGFSETYTKLIRSQLDAGHQPSADEKNRMKILTSRGLQRVFLIAENAARGRFPTYDAFPEAISAKDSGIYDVLNSERRWEQFPEWAAWRESLLAGAPLSQIR